MTRTILWRRLDLPGHEICTVARVGDDWRLRGAALFTYDGMPCSLCYSVVCDSTWRTTSARVSGRRGEAAVDLDVTVDMRRRWRLNGVDCPAVEGCLDLDLGFSPSTNLLPIRRLSLEPGESADVVAAWLPFPSLDFEPLAQTYRRESVGSYRYESAGGAFVRTLEVDESGMVTRYPGLWELEAAWHG